MRFPKGRVSESKIQKEILDYLQSQDIFAVKTISTNVAGCPDILSCIEGKFVAFEVKSPKGRVSERQESVIQRIAQCKGFAFVVYNVEDVIKAIDFVLASKSPNV